MDYDIKDTVYSAEEAVEALRRILSGQIVVDEAQVGPDGDYPPQAERPALNVLFEGSDPLIALQHLRDQIRQECSGGTIIVSRE